MLGGRIETQPYLIEQTEKRKITLTEGPGKKREKRTDHKMRHGGTMEDIGREIVKGGT